jgi:hypothetical protein
LRFFIKNISYFFILLSLLSGNNLISQQKFKPQDLGLQTKLGQIDKNRMTKFQKDTIAFGFFNFEDYLEDIAIYYKNKGEIIFYRNAGNGYAEKWRVIKTDSNDIKNIKALPPDNYLLNPNQRWSLEINYEDEKKKEIPNKEIINPDYIETKAPYRDFLYEPKAFLYNISFIEQWRSERNGQPVWHVEVGDIDRDGKNESIYTFYPLNGAYSPTHMVIFECVNQNQYRIDWDSIFPNGGFYNLSFPFTDFDRDGNKEFFSMGKNLFGYTTIGLFECYGEGVYKFFDTPFMYQAFPMDVNLLDSATINGITGPGFWICYSNWGPSYNTAFQKFRFKQKYSFAFDFDNFINGNIPGNDYFVYSISASDIDKDGKEEIVEGDTQWGTGYIGYWDSTGVSTHKGYQYKVIYPDAPISGGYLIGKDLDGDGYKEIMACGIGYESGSIGLVKHTGKPGQNQFSTVWWDSAGIEAMPNYGIDTGSIEGKYTILYPTYYEMSSVWPIDRLFLITYSRIGNFDFYQSCRTVKDSMVFLDAKFWDMDNDGKINVVAPLSIFKDTGNYYDCLSDWEQFGTIGISNNILNVSADYRLFQNYPNPFNINTKIKYQVLKNSKVKLILYNILGKEIKILVNQNQGIGIYEINLNGNDLSSGIYFYTLFVNNEKIDTKKMLLIK